VNQDAAAADACIRKICANAEGSERIGWRKASIIVDHHSVPGAVQWRPDDAVVSRTEPLKHATTKILLLTGGNHWVRETEMQRKARADTGAVFGIANDPTLGPIGEARGVGKNKYQLVTEIGLEDAALTHGTDHATAVIRHSSNGHHAYQEQ
jgi:hypothetical protein